MDPVHQRFRAPQALSQRLVLGFQLCYPLAQLARVQRPGPHGVERCLQLSPAILSGMRTGLPFGPRCLES